MISEIVKYKQPYYLSYENINGKKCATKNGWNASKNGF